MSDADASDKKIQEIIDDIDTVDRWVNTAADNGLFNIENNDGKFKAIEDNLRNARFNASIKMIYDSQYHLSVAQKLFYQATNCAGPLWRFKIIYGGPIWLYLFGFLIGIFLFYYFLGSAFVMKSLGIVEQEMDTHYFSSGIYAATWGAIGGILRGFWYLKDNLSNNEYRNAFGIYYISTPFIGAILGVLTYFIIAGGVVTLTTTDVSIENLVVVLAIATVAGYSWNEIIELIVKVAGLITGVKDKKDNNE